MKKVIYSLAVLFSVALVSCGGNKAAEATDSETIQAETIIEEPVMDSAADTTMDSAAAPVEAAADSTVK